MADTKPETKPERPVLLVLYADGEIYVPNAQVYGDLLTVMDIIVQEATKIRQRLYGIPLRAPQEPTA